MKKILFVCNDTVGLRMAGPAIRCMELAKALSVDFDVTVAATKLDDGFNSPVRLIDATSIAIMPVAALSDVVIVQGDALRRFPGLMEINAALIADMYCPIPLEYHVSSSGVPEDVRLEHGWHVSRVMYEQLFFADYFLCASKRQQDFWLGALTMAGRINGLSIPDGINTGLDRLIACTPFGLQNDKPLPDGSPLRDRFRIPSHEFLMVWGGGIYDWFDPLTIIEAVARLDNEGLRTHLVFLGVKHPNPGISDHDRVSIAVESARNLGVLDRLVHFNFGWVEYSSRHKYLLDADAGVSAHFDNVETRYAFRTRMLDYLWCGLPIITTQGDEFGEIVDREGLGFSLGYKNIEQWCHAVRDMATNTELRARCRSAVAKERERFLWSTVAIPLIEICRELVASDDRRFVRPRARHLGLGPAMRTPSVLSKVRAAYARGGVMEIAGIVKRIIQYRILKLR